MLEAYYRRQLRLGPWRWPADDDEPRMRDARKIAGEVPAPQIGTSVALTVLRQTATLWLIQVAPAAAADQLYARPLASDARAAWRTAAMTLPRALPVLWTSVAAAAAIEPTAIRLESTGPSVEQVIEGPSFGLAFVLALASHVLDIIPPADVVAAAEVHADGSLGGVAALRTKFRALTLAPRIARVLVADQQLPEAKDAIDDAGAKVEVVGVRNVAHALRVAFGEDLPTRLVEGRTESQRDEIVTSLFRLALAPRASAIDWTPIAQAAALALQWKGLDDGQRFALGLAGAIAARHQNNVGTMPPVPASWFDRQPREIQMRIAAQIVQQSTDTGQPDPPVALAFAAPLLPNTEQDERHAFLSQLRLCGAVARLWALTGRAADALARQERLALLFFASFEYGDLSYQLSEWFRLAGALDDRESFDRATRLYERVLALAGFEADARAYVDLARARSMVTLGVQTGAEPVALLERLADPKDARDRSAHVPDHVRWSAARWLIRASASAGAAERAVTVEVRLAEAASRSDIAAPFAVLAEIDRRLVDGRDTSEPIERLCALQRGPVRHLVAAAAPGNEAEYVARFYPY